MKTIRSLYRGACVLTLAAALAACASPQFIKPGETGTAVVARLGKPTASFPRPGGGERLIYSGQPMGQQVWISDLDAGGKVVNTFQALTSERFAMLDHGDWDAKRLMYEFGPPARVDRVGLHGEQIVWNYRFKEDDVWNSLMYVYVTDAGVVYRHHPGPDPLYMTDRTGLW